MTLPQTRFDFLADVPAAEDLGRVHFVAIGGAGMSGVARILLAKGVSVSGSDARESTLLHAPIAAARACARCRTGRPLVCAALSSGLSSRIAEEMTTVSASSTRAAS